MGEHRVCRVVTQKTSPVSIYTKVRRPRPERLPSGRTNGHLKTALPPAHASTQPPPQSPRSRGSSNRTQTQKSRKREASQTAPRQLRLSQAGTTCAAARASRVGICPAPQAPLAPSPQKGRKKEHHTINCASASKTSDATRLRDAGVARRARAAPYRTRRIEPMITAPTSARFACRVAYARFASVVGDGRDMSRRRIEGGESVRVMGYLVGSKTFERD